MNSILSQHEEQLYAEPESLYNHGNKLSGQLRKTALYLTPQAI